MSNKERGFSWRWCLVGDRNNETFFNERMADNAVVAALYQQQKLYFQFKR